MANNIELCQGWRLLTDSNNWIIAKEDDGRLSPEGYYSTLDSAIKSFVALKIRGFNSTSLLALNNSIKALEKRLSKSVHCITNEMEGRK